MKRDLMLRTIAFRKEGYSVKELHHMLGVSKSTVSRWIQGVSLSIKARDRLRQRCTAGQIAAQKRIREISQARQRIASDFGSRVVRRLRMNTDAFLVVCAMVFHCEGDKSSYHVTFTNSDPALVATFVYLFRKCFSVNEKKFRVLMQLHEYHNEEKQKRFWSNVTGVPKGQFHKTYQKKTNGIYQKEGYQGCVRVYYGDSMIAKKMAYIAKKFLERYK